MNDDKPDPVFAAEDLIDIIDARGRHIETLCGLLRQVLTVLDGGAEFQCGPKGKHLLLREQIRAAVPK